MVEIRTYEKEIFVFVSKQNSHLSAMTMDGAGHGLPIAFGPWVHSVDHDVSGVGHRAEIESAIALRGFYLSRPDGVAW